MRNHFQSIIGTSIIQNDLANFLQFSELIRLLHTCHDCCQILDGEYDTFLKEISLARHSYIVGNNMLKFEIRKLYKYFNVEMSYRNSKERFTFPQFFTILDGSFFTTGESLNLIENENLKELKEKFGYKSFEKCNFKIPHFPQISVELFKVRHNPLEIESLVKNACEAPYLFDDLFKHLVKSVYGINRDDLIDEIAMQFTNMAYPIHLELYNCFIKGAFDNAANEISFLVLLPMLLSYIFVNFAANLILGNIVWITIALFLQLYIKWDYYAKYENFEECNSFILSRYYIYRKYSGKYDIPFKSLNENIS